MIELTVRDVMTTEPRVLSPSSVVADAARMMHLCGFRHVPVVDDGKLVGIVSRHDIDVALHLGDQVPISAVMTRAPRRAHPDMPAQQAASLLLNHKIGCLPVVDEALHLVGIVTESDFVHLAERGG